MPSISSKGYFITGTDTEIGKTYTTVRLIRYLISQGYRVAGLKPIASGCDYSSEGVEKEGQYRAYLRNNDALQIQQSANITLPYERVNRYAFEPAIAPHIAATQIGKEIDLQAIQEDVNFAQQQADLVVVEAAGGWLVPINDQHNIADIASKLQLEVIIVVGIRLGCINHALLTFNEISRSGVKIAGWVANEITEDACYSRAQIEEIKKRTLLPCLSEISFQEILTDSLWSLHH